MINKILQKYEGQRNYWFPDVKDTNLYADDKIKEKYSNGCSKEEARLLKKYKSYIPKGWYGFSFGQPLHLDWFKIIDEFLEYLLKLQNEKRIENFEIHQIKLKFGGLRFYVSYKCEDEELREFIELQIDKLENSLFDEKLIY
jgi:hypothetical protein